MTFGGSGITKPLFEWILKTLPSGSHILELGSGDVSTFHLSQHYRMTSVEDNLEFVNKYNSHYIHAPIVGDWYDVNILAQELPKDYDLLLVDGPTGSTPRWGFINNLALFKTNVPIIIDDTWRRTEKEMAVKLACMTYTLIDCHDFCIMTPRNL